MRVLILSALLACGSAAPSVLYAGVPAVLPAAEPTIPPGDLQAAAIDAQVKAEDQARALADQARELAEQAAENPLEGVKEAIADEPYWQAVEALETTKAQVDGAIASNSPAIARSYIPYVASGAVVSGIPAVIPGYQVPIAAPVAKIAEPAPAAPDAPEAPKAEQTQEKEAAVKTAEEAKPVEAEKSADSVQVKSADLKASAPEPAKNENPFLIQSFAQTHPVFAAPLAIAPVGPALAYTQPWVAPVAYVQPGLKAVATSGIHQVQGQYITPAVLKTQW